MSLLSNAQCSPPRLARRRTVVVRGHSPPWAPLPNYETFHTTPPTHRKMQPAYMVILGDGEIESRSVSLRARNGDQVSGIPLERFLTDLKHEIEEKVSQPALAVNSED